ncbi:MAG: hypothetical protein ACTHM7_19400 [Ginsengibacter sp.]
MLQQRFIVFELDNIKDHPILFPVVTLIIMELFIFKMQKLRKGHYADLNGIRRVATSNGSDDKISICRSYGELR